MSVVFLLGAGASFGESLKPLPNCPGYLRGANARPPLLNGFFKGDLYTSITYPGDKAAQDFAEAFEYVKYLKRLSTPVGVGNWNSLDLEEILTSIELEREFRSPDSDAGARLLLIRNKLIRYIWRILALCTEHKFGEYARLLVSRLRVEDSVITFNWDLLLDQELHPDPTSAIGNGQPWQYHNFFVDGLGILPTLHSANVIYGARGSTGMFLKLHGSLNWLQCTNANCPGDSALYFDSDTQGCLTTAMGIGTREPCRHCGSETMPLLIPPLLRKPITENKIIRSAWGLAKRRLEMADRVVIIGFSAAPTDFYASWLLRTTVGLRETVQVFVVNPENDSASLGYLPFRTRMQNIFRYGYNDEFRTFDQIENILTRVYATD